MALARLIPAPHRVLLALPERPFFAAALACAVVIQVTRRPKWVELRVTAALGAAISAALYRTAGGHALEDVVVVCVSGLGLASLLVLGVQALRARGEARAELLSRWLPALVIPGMVLLSGLLVDLTAAVRPTTYDAFTFHADGALGFQPSFAMGRLFAAAPWLSAACAWIYGALPLAFGVLFVLERRHGPGWQGDVLGLSLAIATGGFLLYFVFPVVGPCFVTADFPGAEPVFRTAPALADPGVPRNCMPSLHTAWALMVFWRARRFGRWPRLFASVFLAGTLMATLGLGFHYLVDLVVAVPFTLAIEAACTEALPSLQPLRSLTLLGSSTAVGLWFLLIRFGTGLLRANRILPWALAVATVGVALWAQRRLARAAEAAPDEPRAEVTPPPLRGAHWAIAAAFFFSGFAALCYEVVFSKRLGLVFGGTARASAVVLATYMAGIALGSWLGGRLAERIRNPLRAYALCEAGIALGFAASSGLLSLARAAYVALAAGTDPGATWLVPLQLGLGALVLSPPTLLMGVTTPLLTRFFTRADPSLGRSVGLLYGLNTLGAALGTILSGYLLLPALGLSKTTLLAVGLNLAVAALAFRLRKTEGARAAPSDAAPEAPTSRFDALPAPWLLGAVGAGVLAVGGAVTFALETTFTHLLAVVAGNSAYAFALMVFAFLVGLAAGSSAGRRWLNASRSPVLLLGALQAGLAVMVLLGIYLWNGLPDYFASFAGYPRTRTFAARELIRFLVCCIGMVPPAFFIGAAYPVAMECVGLAWPDRKVQAMGRAAALNTVGNVLGALAGTFLLVGVLGSLPSLRLLAAVSLGLAALCGFCVPRRRALGAAFAMAAVLALVGQPRSFDLDQLASGANVYFARQGYGHVVDHVESAEGGLTTISESLDASGDRVLTLLTNGKFQGDDSGSREMAAQAAFTLFPLLHTGARGQALIIGLGTGTSARVAVDAGFHRVDVAELARDIVDMTHRHFGKVHHGVLDRPDVRLHVTDGRNLLQLSRERYDLIGMEVSSIWFAGAANLYNREMYERVRDHLSERGVLQQWIQLHHLQPADLVSIIATLRAVFPNVWLYEGGAQGVLVACAWDCRPGPEELARLDQTPALHETLALLGGRAGALLESRLLDPRAVDVLLAASPKLAGVPAEALISTDDNLLLEYSTPRGNVSGYTESYRRNVGLLRGFQPPSPLDGTRLPSMPAEPAPAQATQPVP